MQYQLANKNTFALLHKILVTLARGLTPPQARELKKNFKESIPIASDEPIYAVALKNSQPIIIYSIYREHKLTRNLSTIYHTENIYENPIEGLLQLNMERKQFQGWMVNALNDGYKIMGFNCGQGVFTPFQKYMDIQDKFTPKL